MGLDPPVLCLALTIPLARAYTTILQYDSDSDGLLTEKEWRAYLKVRPVVDKFNPDR